VTEHPSTRFIYGVYGFDPDVRYRQELVASFFHNSDAQDFAMNPERFGAPVRNLYVTEGRRDKRLTGYRAPWAYPALSELHPDYKTKWAA
jgi:hypothetical protein